MNLLVKISSYCFAEILQIYFGHYLEEMHFCHVQLSLSKFDDWVHFRWCIRRYITSKSNIKGSRNSMVEYNRLVRIIRINKGFIEHKSKMRLIDLSIIFIIVEFVAADIFFKGGNHYWFLSRYFWLKISFTTRLLPFYIRL